MKPKKAAAGGVLASSARRTLIRGFIFKRKGKVFR
jgi:hypothetical protein